MILMIIQKKNPQNVNNENPRSKVQSIGPIGPLRFFKIFFSKESLKCLLKFFFFLKKENVYKFLPWSLEVLWENYFKNVSLEDFGPLRKMKVGFKVP